MTRRRRFSAKALTTRLMEFNGRCAECGCKVGGPAGLEWDHVVPLAMGGDDEIENLQPLCRMDHRAKTKADAGHIAKAKRMSQRQMGIKRQPKSVIPGSRGTRWKRTLRGETVRRDRE